MKKLLNPLLLLLLLMLPFSCASMPETVPVKQVNTQSLAHKAMHVMAQFAGEDGDLCTAEAIGPHTILTATHCMLTNPDSVKIDGAPVQITQRINDGNDHTILTFTNVYLGS